MILNIAEISTKIQNLIKDDLIVKNILKALIMEQKTIDEAKIIAKRRGLNIQTNRFKNAINLFREYENNIEGLQEAFVGAVTKVSTEIKDTYAKKTILDKKREAEVIIKKLYDPNAGTEELSLVYGRGKQIIEELKNNKLKLEKPSDRDELVRVNIEIIRAGKNIILDKMKTMQIKNMADLKSLSDLIDTAFKQNRLIQGESTRNIAVGIKELYDKIVDEADTTKIASLE